jgi:hypothetical protein
MAYLWWTLAVQNGANDIKHKLMDLADKVTEAQTREAEQLVVQWKTKH